MRTLGTSLSLALLALAACGNDSSSGTIDASIVIIDAADLDAAPDAPPDAPSYDFTCYQSAAPTTAADPITISGTVTKIAFNGTSLSTTTPAGVSIKSCRDACTGQDNFGTVTSGSGGTFTTGSLATGGAPLEGYVVATAVGSQDTWVYPPAPLVANLTNAPVFMIDSALYGQIGFVVTHSAGKAIVAVAVTDCSGTPIDGATVTAKRGGTDLGVVNSGAMLGQPGSYIVTNVDPDPTNAAAATVVSASYDGKTFLSRTVRSSANVITTVPIRPGY